MTTEINVLSSTVRIEVDPATRGVNIIRGGGFGPNGPAGPPGDTGPPGLSADVFPYDANATDITGNPESGRILWDDATMIDSTELNISVITQVPDDVGILLSLVDESDNLLIKALSPGGGSETPPSIGSFSQDGGTVLPNTLTMPASIDAGDLLLVFSAIETQGNAVPITDGGGGWTRIENQHSNDHVHYFAIFAKIAEGSDTIQVTGYTGGAFDDNANVLVRIPAAEHAVTDVTSLTFLSQGADAGSPSYPDMGDPNAGQLLIAYCALSYDEEVGYTGWAPSFFTEVDISIARVSPLNPTVTLMVATKVTDGEHEFGGSFITTENEPWIAGALIVPAMSSTSFQLWEVTATPTFVDSTPDYYTFPVTLIDNDGDGEFVEGQALILYISRNGEDGSSGTGLTDGDKGDVVVSGTGAVWTVEDSVAYVKPQAVNAQTGTTYTVDSTDVGKLITLDNGSPITVSLPQDSDETIAIGCYVYFMAIDTGQVELDAGSGATVIVPDGLTPFLTGLGSRAAAQKIAANTWSIFGDLVAA